MKHLLFILSTVFLAFVLMSSAGTPQQQVPRGTVECDLCHFIVKEIDNLLDDDKTHAFIEKQVNATCHLALFEKHAAVCEKILDFGIEEIIKFIEEHETPTNVCGPDQLNLCTSAKRMWVQ